MSNLLQTLPWTDAFWMPCICFMQRDISDRRSWISLMALSSLDADADSESLVGGDIDLA